jgi:hypothetical protein
MKTIARIASINLAVFLTALIVAELIFGSWIFGPYYGRMNLPRNVSRLLEVSQFVPGNQLVCYTRDAYGLRRDYRGNLARIDALAIGGLTTDERYVTDGETRVAQLQEQFRAHGRPFTLANAAIDGQSSLGDIKTLTHWLQKIPGLRPKHLLFYVGINDVALDDATPMQFDQIASPSRRRQISQFVMNQSALYHLYRTVLGTIRAERAQLIHGQLTRNVAQWLPIHVRCDIEDTRRENADFLTAYRERLRILVELSRRLGAEPIFTTQTRGDYKEEDGQSFVLKMVRDGHQPSAISHIRRSRAQIQAFQ